MEIIKQILEITGHGTVEDMELNDSVTLSAPGVMDLTIEKVGEGQLSVAHYWKQRGDMMRDPEIVFRTGGEWVPVQFRQDPTFLQTDEDGLEIQDFIETWEQNLRSQGFVDAAKDEQGQQE